MSYRIIVTGCRDWTDEEAVKNVILTMAAKYVAQGGLRVLVGDCPTGADHIAINYCVTKRIAYMCFVANWGSEGKRAGPLRNREMVSSGADLCVAFWDGKSRGTLDCLTQSTAAGIPVRIVPRGRL